MLITCTLVDLMLQYVTNHRLWSKFVYCNLESCSAKRNREENKSNGIFLGHAVGSTVYVSDGGIVEYSVAH